MKAFFILFLVLLLSDAAYAQQRITMRDNTKISASIISIEGDKLKLKEGAITLTLVSGVYYSDSVSVLRDDILIQQLIRKDIPVYFNETPIAKKFVSELDNLTAQEAKQKEEKKRGTKRYR